MTTPEARSEQSPRKPDTKPVPIARVLQNVLLTLTAGGAAYLGVDALTHGSITHKILGTLRANLPSLVVPPPEGVQTGEKSSIPSPEVTPTEILVSTPEAPHQFLGEFLMQPLELPVQHVGFTNSTEIINTLAINFIEEQYGEDASRFVLGNNFIVRDLKLDCYETDFQTGMPTIREDRILPTITLWDKQSGEVRRWTVWELTEDGGITLLPADYSGLDEGRQLKFLEMQRKTPFEGGRNTIDYKDDPLIFYVLGQGWFLKPFEYVRGVGGVPPDVSIGPNRTSDMPIDLRSLGSYQFEPMLAWIPEILLQD